MAWFPFIGIEIDYLPRVAFNILGFELYFYGLFIGLGFLAGTGYSVYEAKRTGQNPDIYTELLYYAIIAAIIGARLYYVAFTWDNYKNDLLKIFALRSGGLAVYGGVIAAVAVGVWYAKKHAFNLRLLADTAAPGIALGQAIGRWGNFFNREAFGGYTQSLFAMRYPVSDVYAVPPAVLEHLVNVGGIDYIQVHPTFLYESIWCIFIFFLLNIFKYHKKSDGAVFCAYIILYGAGRFFIEGLRTDQLILWGTDIAVSQIMSLLWVAAGILILHITNKK